MERKEKEKEEEVKQEKWGKEEKTILFFSLQYNFYLFMIGLSDSSVGKESTSNEGDPSLIPGLNLFITSIV